MVGVTQTQLAIAAGVDVERVRQWEGGGRPLSASRLVSFAELLDVPLAWFFGDMPADVQPRLGGREALAPLGLIADRPMGLGGPGLGR